MNLLDRFHSGVVMICVALAVSGCAAPGSVQMSRHNTTDAQAKADWDACVEQVRTKDGDAYSQLGRMVGESLWGAPFTKECMQSKGYWEVR
jgi:hypothetical protein